MHHYLDMLYHHGLQTDAEVHELIETAVTLLLCRMFAAGLYTSDGWKINKYAVFLGGRRGQWITYFSITNERSQLVWGGEDVGVRQTGH